MVKLARETKIYVCPTGFATSIKPRAGRTFHHLSGVVYAKHVCDIRLCQRTINQLNVLIIPEGRKFLASPRQVSFHNKNYL